MSFQTYMHNRDPINSIESTINAIASEQLVK